jgi:uncharacterized protein (TIGR02271 family)
MPTIEDVKTWHGQEVHDPSGQKIGTLEDVYLDRSTGEPEWAAIRTGLFGTRLSFAPIDGASLSGGAVAIGYEKDLVKAAPNVEADGELSEEEERRLYEHYGRGYDWSGEDRTVGHDTSGPTTDSAMTRSEEELRVGKERVEAGRARLRKVVVTENVTKTVPVQREEVVVEREPITDANADRAYDGPAISEEEHEVVLHEERPVVAKEAVPKERVRLDTQTVTEQETVSEEVRKEEIRAEGDVDGRTGTGI